MPLSQKAFKNGLQMINAVCVNQMKTQDTIEVYYLLLKDLEDQPFLEGIALILREKENVYNPPSPAEIIKYSKKFSQPESIPSEIFDYIKRDIILFGSKQPSYKPKILETIEAVGGWEYLRNASSESLENIRKDFCKLYYFQNSNIKSLQNN